MIDLTDTTDPGGPFLAAAVISEAVLREENGLNSIIRIIDQVTLAVPQNYLAEEAGLLPFQTQLFVSFRAGSFEGEAQVGVRAVNSRGETGSTTTSPVLFRGRSIGPQSGANLHVNLNLGLHGPGQYWIDILLDDKVITRVPLKVLVEPLEDELSTEEPGNSDVVGQQKS